MDKGLGNCMLIEFSLNLVIYLMGASSHIYRQNDESRISDPPWTFGVAELLDIRLGSRQIAYGVSRHLANNSWSDYCCHGDVCPQFVIRKIG